MRDIGRKEARAICCIAKCGEASDKADRNGEWVYMVRDEMGAGIY